MSYETYYKPGDWSVICDYTGFKMKRSECMFTWDGYLVRNQSWETRQPQDFVRGVMDHFAVEPGQVRDQVDPVFLSANEVKKEDL